MKGGPQTWNELQEEPLSIRRACLSLDGTLIAAIFLDKTLCIYDATTGEVILPPFEVDENPWTVVFSWDGKLVASGGNALRLWNVETGEEVESFDIEVYSLAFSPDGTCIAAGCIGKEYPVEEDGKGRYNIRVIDLELAKTSHSPGYFDVPSGGRISLVKGEVRPSPFEGHDGHVRSVAYSPDGKQIASCSYDSTVRVWDVSTGSRIRTFSADRWIFSLAFSPDGTQIASDKGLWDLSTGSFTPHNFGKLSDTVAFSPDGRYLASGSAAECQIWDASTLQSILRLVGHTNFVRSVAFFPDGKKIMSASWDNTIRVWDVDLLEERGEMDGWQSDWSLEGCWILGPKEELLFWTPKLAPFRHPRNTLVIGECPEIDFSNFVHGDEWVKCREPLQNKEVRGVIY